MSFEQTQTLASHHDWKTAGWQGVTAATPDDWNLVGYGGDSKTGNFRLDSGSPEAGALGLEVRWSQPKGTFTDADLEKRLEPFFSTLGKAARKQRHLTKTESHPVKDTRFPERDSSRSFSWRSDRMGIGRIWHCADCGRLCIAQVVGQAGRELKTTAQEVLASMRCHASEIGWRTWALYDLSTEIPVDYQLKGQPQLMNVYLQMTFQNGQSTDSLSVEQWSMAGVQIKGVYLDEWFRTKNAALEATLRYRPQETVVQGHPALELAGRRAGIPYWIGQAPAQLIKLQMPASHYAAVLWECPESNKITLVQSFSRRPQETLLRDVVARTICH